MDNNSSPAGGDHSSGLVDDKIIFAYKASIPEFCYNSNYQFIEPVVSGNNDITMIGVTKFSYSLAGICYYYIVSYFIQNHYILISFS
jgi:hypothetical protein